MHRGFPDGQGLLLEIRLLSLADFLYNVRNVMVRELFVPDHPPLWVSAVDSDVRCKKSVCCVVVVFQDQVLLMSIQPFLQECCVLLDLLLFFLGIRREDVIWEATSKKNARCGMELDRKQSREEARKFSLQILEARVEPDIFDAAREEGAKLGRLHRICVIESQLFARIMKPN
eukprot:1183252-Rhodomonas_salina.1